MFEKARTRRKVFCPDPHRSLTVSAHQLRCNNVQRLRMKECCISRLAPRNGAGPGPARSIRCYEMLHQIKPRVASQGKPGAQVSWRCHDPDPQLPPLASRAPERWVCLSLFALSLKVTPPQPRRAPPFCQSIKVQRLSMKSVASPAWLQKRRGAWPARSLRCYEMLRQIKPRAASQALICGSGAITPLLRIGFVRRFSPFPLRRPRPSPGAPRHSAKI